MMTKDHRRQYGTGSVFQRADGKWIGRLEAGVTKDGTRRRITRTGSTEAEVKRRLKEAERRISSEGIPQAGVGRATVKSWSVVWLDEHARSARPKYFATDKSAVKKWILPAIGHRRLNELTPADVRAVRTAITKDGRSTTTARQVQGTLTRMLRAARMEGHQVPVRVTEVKAPAKAVNDRDAIPIESALRILETAMQRDDKVRWVAALLQGMRQGEVLGLTWPYVDVDASLLDVSWQLQALSYVTPYDRSSGFRVPDGYEHRQLVGAWHLVRPKTARGQRVLPLVPWMTDGLREWRDVAPANPWGLVWSANGRPIDPKDDTAAWVSIQKAAGVAHPSGRPYYGHELRHATATLLAEGDVPTYVIEAILGHATLVKSYLHANQAATRKALEAVASRLKLDDRSPGEAGPGARVSISRAPQ